MYGTSMCLCVMMTRVYKYIYIYIRSHFGSSHPTPAPSSQPSLWEGGVGGVGVGGLGLPSPFRINLPTSYPTPSRSFTFSYTSHHSFAMACSYQIQQLIHTQVLLTNMLYRQHTDQHRYTRYSGTRHHEQHWRHRQGDNCQQYNGNQDQGLHIHWRKGGGGTWPAGARPPPPHGWRTDAGHGGSGGEAGHEGGDGREDINAQLAEMMERAKAWYGGDAQRLNQAMKDGEKAMKAMMAAKAMKTIV